MPRTALWNSTRGAALAFLCGSGALFWAAPAGAQDPAPEEPGAPEPEAEPPAAPEPVASESDAVETAPAGEAQPGADASAAVEAPSDLAAAGETFPDPLEDGALGEDFAFDDGSLENVTDEVVVTVDRRRKDLQDYSGTASAFSERQLTNLGINDVRQMSSLVPGLHVATQESGTAITIRGIGSDNFTELGDSAVALHVDGVYMPRPRGLGQMFFDIARVEVNSGPQGTIRGRNAVGGSVNIVTNQPKLGEFESSAEASFGTYSYRSYQGMVNIPIGDRLALRVAATSLVHDPLWTNAGPIHDIRGAQSADNWAMRSTVRWQPVDPLEISVTYDYLAERGTGYLGAQFINELNREDENGNPLVDPNDYDAIGNPRNVYQRGWHPWTDMWHRGVRGNVTFDTGPVIFEAMASYRDQDYKQLNTYPPGVVIPGTDTSIYNPDEFDGQQWHNTSEATILELRALAPDDARFRWALGAFYFREDQGAFLGQVRDPAGGYGGGEFNMPSTIGTSYAGYADATFDVVDNFRLLGGLRLTRDYKERKGGIWATWVNTGPDGLGRFATDGFNYRGFDRLDYGIPPANDLEARVNWFFDGIDSFGARDEVAQRLCNDPVTAAPGEEQEPRLSVDAEGRFRCANGVRDTLPSNIFNIVRQDNEVTTSYVDWRAGVEYDLHPDNLLYFTVSTGHKAAGFNDTVASGDEVFNSDWGPEFLLSFELGSKNVFANRTLRLNASAFFFTYEGMQFQTIVPVGPPPPRDENGDVAIDPETGMPYEDNRPGTAVRQNAQEQTNVYGIDVDFTWALPAGLEAEVHALIMDARFSDGTYVSDTRLDPGGLNAQVDLGGNWLPRASPYTFNYSLSQLVFTEVGSWDWMIQGQTRATHYMTVYNGDGTRLLPKGPDWDPRLDEQPNYMGLLDNPHRLTDVVPTYTTINVGAGWKHPGGRLSIRGYVNNLFDVTYATFIGSGNGNNIRFYNNQRMAGVRVRVDW